MFQYCRYCKLEFELTKFVKSKNYTTGYSFECLSCARIRTNKYYTVNKTKVNERHKKHYINNKDKTLNKHKEYNKNNKDKIRQQQAIYNQNNIDKIRLYRNKYNKFRESTDINYKLRKRISSAISNRLIHGKSKKSFLDKIGYTVFELRTHLESKFTKGMSWENYGRHGWEIDHIIPEKMFKYDNMNHPAFKACWSLNNLQPLWSTNKIAVLYGENSNYIGNREKSDNIVITNEIEHLLNLVNV